MKHGWEYKQIGDVCEVINGLWTGKKPPFVNVGVIRNTNFTKECTLDPSNIFYTDVEEKAYAKRKLQHGDIIIEKSGGSDKQPVGRPILFNLNGEFSFSNFTSVLRIKDASIIADYLHMALVGIYFQGKTRALQSKTTGIHNLDFNKYLRLTIPVPPLPVQQQICSLLDKLSRVIEAKKEQLKELDNLAQAIFYDMFGDPVTNDKGWETSTIDNISTEKLSYGSGASAVEYDGRTRYIRITDINEIGDLNKDIKSPSEIDDKYLLKEGDLLFARSGATVGKTYCHNEKNGRCIYAGYLIKMRPNTLKVLPKYVFYYTKTDYYKAFVMNAQNSVAQPNINAKQYGALMITVPPLPLQQAFAEKVEAIERQKELINQSIREVQTLFDSRMDYWFSD